MQKHNFIFNYQIPKHTELCEVNDIDKTLSSDLESPPVTLYKLPPLLPQKKARKEPSRLVLEPYELGYEYPILIKAKVQGVFEYLPHIGIQPNTEHIFNVFNMTKSQGYEVINAESFYHLNHHLSLNENLRGRL